LKLIKDTEFHHVSPATLLLLQAVYSQAEPSLVSKNSA
jgi:hypothetical protein